MVIFSMTGTYTNRGFKRCLKYLLLVWTNGDTPLSTPRCPVLTVFDTISKIVGFRV